MWFPAAQLSNKQCAGAVVNKVIFSSGNYTIRGLFRPKPTCQQLWQSRYPGILTHYSAGQFPAVLMDLPHGVLMTAYMCHRQHYFKEQTCCAPDNKKYRDNISFHEVSWTSLTSYCSLGLNNDDGYLGLFGKQTLSESLYKMNCSSNNQNRGHIGFINNMATAVKCWIAHLTHTFLYLLT